jgi:hypothetical protein
MTSTTILRRWGKSDGGQIFQPLNSLVRAIVVQQIILFNRFKLSVRSIQIIRYAIVLALVILRKIVKIK